MLKVRSRLSLLVLVLLLLGAARPLSSSEPVRSPLSTAELSTAVPSTAVPWTADSSGGSSNPEAERAPATPAPQPADAPCDAGSAASTAELDGSPDDVADPELALPVALRVQAPSAQQQRCRGMRAGARRAVPEAPFKPPNR